MKNVMLKQVYATGDDRLIIHEDEDGRLYLTTNAYIQELIAPSLYASHASSPVGWTRDELAAGLFADGVPASLVERICDQAGL